MGFISPLILCRTETFLRCQDNLLEEHVICHLGTSSTQNASWPTSLQCPVWIHGDNGSAQGKLLGKPELLITWQVELHSFLFLRSTQLLSGSSAQFVTLRQLPSQVIQLVRTSPLKLQSSNGKF